ncbi:YciI family protein [Variovorax paradoxus]|uniref:YciI family protein n=1 Tax=Variovorax paradoxus TaxID=34073 RepID=A0A5Q0M5Y6_VARPD|nr:MULTISPECIES: YciI family protein [Variovorax]QFZ83862.1 YciI family protein [Variovorax paradoxus]QOF77081.1 YciI family protein [Variovorax sp. 38R]
MRFMLLMIPHGYESAAPGTVPDDVERVGSMMAFNESLQKAGVLIGCEGLHPPSMGARVSFPGGKPKVVDGPFAEVKEVLGGYWLIDVASRAEAIEWASRCPGSENEVIEIRQVQEMEDFSPEVQDVASEFTSMQQTLKK